jgi:hypothetical protein
MLVTAERSKGWQSLEVFNINPDYGSLDKVIDDPAPEMRESDHWSPMRPIPITSQA